MIGSRNILVAAAAAGLVATMALAQAAPERDAAWHNGQALYLLNLKPADGWRATASGLRYRRVKAGTGAQRPAPTDIVTIGYAGRFIDGSEFDASAPGAPAAFPLPRLIQGWQEGVPLMEVGSTYEFAIPYTIAYGASGKGPIPGGATLLFTIELIGIGESAG